MANELLFEVFRYSPDNGKEPCFQAFNIEVVEGMTVLEALQKIKETLDPTVSMRFSCRMAICGSCAMLINGKPMLACDTQLAEVSGRVITLAPLPNFGVIKDLVPDLDSLFNKHLSMRPYMERDDKQETAEPAGEFYQSEEDLVKYLQFAYCIKCGCCMSACPTLATDDEYFGPMPLAQAYRYNADTRDNGYEKRKNTIGSSDGVFKCHYAGECSNVCPKGVDPGKAIQFIKRALVLDYLNLLNKKQPCRLVGKDISAKPREGIPKPPEFTVE